MDHNEIVIRVKINCEDNSITDVEVDNGTDDTDNKTPTELDVIALQELYKQSNGSGWNNTEGWAESGMSLDPTPYGVATREVDGYTRVDHIDLRNNGLSSTIDFPEIGNLDAMRLFCVYLNDLESTLPEEASGWSSIEYVYLSGSDDVEDLSANYPHEHANIGGGDVHTGKHKGSENNVFTGDIPQSWNKQNWPNLKWIFLNWSDSDESASDGISGIPDSAFDFGDSCEGIYYANNNNVSDTQIPPSIGNNINMTHFAVNCSRDRQWIEGALPSEFSQCISMEFPRFSRQESLTIDFDSVSFNDMSSLKYIIASFCDTKGALPSYLFDGSLPDFIQLNLSWPSGSGISGDLASIIPEMNVKLQVLGLANHNFSGLIPKYVVNRYMILLSLQYNNFSGFETNDWTAMRKIRNVRINKNPELSGKWPYFEWGSVDNFSLYRAGGCNFSDSDKNYIPPNSPNGETVRELIQTAVNSFSG